MLMLRLLGEDVWLLEAYVNRLIERAALVMGGMV
jgi:hypothetical protein